MCGSRGTATTSSISFLPSGKRVGSAEYTAPLWSTKRVTLPQGTPHATQIALSTLTASELRANASVCAAPSNCTVIRTAAMISVCRALLSSPCALLKPRGELSTQAALALALFTTHARACVLCSHTAGQRQVAQARWRAILALRWTLQQLFQLPVDLLSIRLYYI